MEHDTLVMDAAADTDRMMAVTLSGQVSIWDVTPHGPPDLGAIPTEGDVQVIEFDGDSVYSVADVAGHLTTSRFDRRTLERTHAATDDSWVEARISPNAQILAWSDSAGVTSVQGLGTEQVVYAADGCGIVTTIDAQARWVFLSASSPPEGDCGAPVGRFVDPASGEVLRRIDGRTGLADAGPRGTPAEDLAVLQRFEGDAGLIEVHDVMSGALVASVDVTAADPWRPFFSNDGRYVSFGSTAGGGFAFDITPVLDGRSKAPVLVLNPKIEAGPPPTRSSAGDISSRVTAVRSCGCGTSRPANCGSPCRWRRAARLSSRSARMTATSTTRTAAA